MKRDTPVSSGALAPPAGEDAWPAELYLIGCGTTPAGAGAPGARSLGSKAWNLLRMTQSALPVPPAFVLGTHYSIDAAARARSGEPGTWRPGLAALERATGLTLGDSRRPLLVSVRSGAPVSMPGMMETVLNIGLCETTVPGLLRRTGNPRLVWDAYRRLVAAYGEVVAGLPAGLFEEATASLAAGQSEQALDFSELRELARRHLAAYERAAGEPFPQAPAQQLAGAIQAVIASWQAPRARDYRRMNSIADDIGTAVTVQAMVFGNAGGLSGSGVGFTRDPGTGEPSLWVDFLFDAQGEDVVSGRRSAHGHAELSTVLPKVWRQLQELARSLEQTQSDMQDFEFTVQDGQLFLLQTRSGKRTPAAAARIALDLLDEGLIDLAVARERTAGIDRAALTRTRLMAQGPDELSPLAHAVCASNGVAIGEVVLDEARAQARHLAGVPFVLVRRDAQTSDLAALEWACGLLTQRGARTSHAAVVARQLGKVCLVGCIDLNIDETTRSLRIGTHALREGELMTLDGDTGAIYAGALRTVSDCPEALLQRLAALRPASAPVRAGNSAMVAGTHPRVDSGGSRG